MRIPILAFNDCLAGYGMYFACAFLFCNLLPHVPLFRVFDFVDVAMYHCSHQIHVCMYVYNKAIHLVFTLYKTHSSPIRVLQDKIQVQKIHQGIFNFKATPLQPIPLQTLVHHKRRRQWQHIAAWPHTHPVLTSFNYPAGKQLVPI